MKTQNLLLSAVLFLLAAGLSAQSEIPEKKSAFENVNEQKGKFHIAIQNLLINEILQMKTTRTISLRAGYSISNNNLVFLDGRLSMYPRNNINKTIQTSLNYRRYFGKSSFQPFVQSGIGIGYIKYAEDYYTTSSQKFYGIFQTGGGVSYRYKKWGFEVGMQIDFNHNFTGRFQFSPLWGISFSF